MPTLTHSATKAEITVTDGQARAIVAGQKRSADKRKARSQVAVAGEWKVKKSGDA